MSEEILKSLTQLLAIVASQDNIITESERNYVINLLGQDLDPESLNRYIEEFDQLTSNLRQIPGREKEDPFRQLSVKETVQTLAVCNKINRTLEQKQKILLLIKILQLIAVDSNFTLQKQKIIETISAVFNITERELEVIKAFVFHRPGMPVNFEEILLVSRNLDPSHAKETKHIQAELEGEIIFLKLTSVNMYFVKYHGKEETILNGYNMIPGQVYVFSNGSTIKSPLGYALYFSDLIRYYLSEITRISLSYNSYNITYSLPGNVAPLHNVNLSEGPGKLIGIMGVSGVGKTTLLNVLAGINKPTGGKILINGLDLHSKEGKKSLKGIIGYISQDDLLIEELSVYDNLYYNARLCFSGLPEEMLRSKVEEILRVLGLWDRKDLRVGNVLDKKLSGGQRKRLNIALELIREPAILFVDEPTSGLSSRDSENVMDLLKELTYKGKLVIVVIHQPSSDIYKLFDRIYILDTGGYPVYYGNPIEAITYFKKAARQIKSDTGICASCGTVNPEQIFNIIEERTVDEFGNIVERRKITPRQWGDLFKKSVKIDRVLDESRLPASSLRIPPWFSQIWIFLKRDFLKKISDRQYLLVNLLESPVLAAILAWIVRYRNYNEHGAYRFRFDENFPVFIMMSIIVSLFFGLMVSAEEIIGDRKNLKRESFLNLSWNSYLLSKLALLFIISAIQTLTYVWISNTILEIRGMFLPFWIALFSVSCFANILGLNISSAFRATVTIYILIPLLIIPQMILSGLLVSFDTMNDVIGNKAKVPLLADLVTTRWAYEAMAVYQFKNNLYEKPLFPVELEEYQSGFKSTFYTEKLNELIRDADRIAAKDTGRVSEKAASYLNRELDNKLAVIRDEIIHEPQASILAPGLADHLTSANFSKEMKEELFDYVSRLRDLYLKKSNEAHFFKERMLDRMKADYAKTGRDINEIKNQYYNDKLADMVRNSGSVDKVTIYHQRIVMLADPVFHIRPRPEFPLDYRAQFYAPYKSFLGFSFNTYGFNISVIWFLAFLLYVLLYFEALRKMIEALPRLRRKFTLS